MRERRDRNFRLLSLLTFRFEPPSNHVIQEVEGFILQALWRGVVSPSRRSPRIHYSTAAPLPIACAPGVWRRSWRCAAPQRLAEKGVPAVR